MRNGFKIYDADTHVQPWAETMEPYLSARVRELVPDLNEHRAEIKIGLAAEVREPPYKHWYRFSSEGGWGGGKPRKLGDAAADPDAKRHFQTFMGTEHPTEGGGDIAKIRLQDMDREGIDVHMMVPAGANGHANPEVEIEFIRANHRFLHDFCGEAPDRLKSLIVATGRCVNESVEEIKRWGDERWAVGVQTYLPLDYPLDHPDLDPIWKAAAERNLTIVHHSFAGGYPGYRDLWDNPFIGRTASHPWGAMRAVASFVGGGIMERYPDLKFAVLECGFGWLPFWAARMNDQVIYMGYVSDDLKKKASDYLTGGRFFTSIVLHEGEDMVRMVNTMMGDHILMFGSDYPHAESRFPKSADVASEWTTLTDDEKRKLFWENPVRAFGEP